MTSTEQPMPATWSNWSGRLRVDDGELVFIRSEADAAAAAAHAAAAGTTLRTTGSGHSHAPLVPNQTIVDVSALAGVQQVVADTAGPTTATIGAGTPIYAIGPALHRYGLALHNQGDIDRQQLAGAVATGTHGTGLELRNFSSAVTHARLATASGDLVDCSPTSEPEIHRVAQHHLGAAGIVTQLTLDVRRAYRLRERVTVIEIDELVPRLDALGAEARHVEFFWFPASGKAVLKHIDETDDDPEYPLATEGARVGWSYEVLPNHRTWPHVEMEYSVPLDDGPACLEALRELFARSHPTMDWPVEYRLLAADDVWMSTAYQRPTATISLHMPVADDEQPLFRAAEEIFTSFEGRPHWGKVHHLDGPALAARHPRWDDWWSARDAVDPQRTFLNDWLRSIAP